MKQKWSWLSMTVVAGVAASSAPAQIAPGRSGSSTMSSFGGDEVWRTLDAFGSCYALQNWPQAFELLATTPGSREEAVVYRRLFRSHNQSCLGEGTVRLSVAPDMVRGAIAEGLYRRGYAVPSNLIVAAPPPGAEIRTFSEAARCYATTHREQVRTLITETRPGSRQEMEAINALSGEFSTCLPPRVRNRTFFSTEIRFRLAEALLRLPPTAR